MVFLGVIVTGYLLSNSESVVRSEQGATAADVNNGVCGDRRADSDNNVFLQEVKPKGFFMFRPLLKALAARYEDKYASFVQAVDAVAAKTGKKGNGQAHIASSKVEKLLERMRGFEKCRGFQTRVNKARNTPVTKNSPTTGILPAHEKYAERLEYALSENDGCCDEACDFADARAGDCTPCSPVCELKEKNGGCFVPKEWCFEKCKDGCDPMDGPCDCRDGKCRVCKGLKSLARYAAKELKVTLSFDVCPELEGRFEGTPPRDVVARQYCGMFDPRKQCSVRLDNLLLRGDAEIKWSEEAAFEQSFPGCAAGLSDVPGSTGKGAEVLAWAKDRVVGQYDGDEGEFMGW